MQSRRAHERDPLLGGGVGGGGRQQRVGVAAAVLAAAAFGMLVGTRLPRRDALMQMPPPAAVNSSEVRGLPPLLYPPASADAAAAPKPPTLLEAWDIIKDKKLVDLTHDFDPTIPSWPGFPPETVEKLFSYAAGEGGSMGEGFWTDRYCLVGQWGTHADPPAHFVQGKRTLDQIRPDEMIMPLVVIDVHEQAAANPDYTIQMSDVSAWEEKNGEIPERAFVVMRTDWSKKWPDSAAMANKDADGVPHYPGWSMEVLSFLYEERKITASGHETTDTDPGVAAHRGDHSLETYIAGTDHYQIELLTNLDTVPPSGALAIASFPKPKDGSGFPARVIAILP